MELLVLILVVTVFWVLFAVMSNPIEETAIQIESDTLATDEYEKAVEKELKEFESQYLEPRVKYLGELNAEISKYSNSENSAEDTKSCELPQRLVDVLKTNANEMWREHQKAQDETKASLIKQARINEFQSNEQALLDQRSKLLSDIDFLALEKEKVVQETKTYMAMMEKLNER